MTGHVMVSVDSGVFWPDAEVTLAFDGRQIRLVPPIREPGSGQLRAYPMAAIECMPGDAEQELVRSIRRFLSALAWREQASVREVDVSYGPANQKGHSCSG